MSQRAKPVPFPIVLALVLAVCTYAAPVEAQGPASLERTGQTSGTTVLLQAVSAVNDQVVWVSGHGATWTRTTDGGATWTTATVPGADGMQFRDVAAFDADVAYLMSAGTGPASRIYRTDDGGRSWRMQYTADHPEAFLDCMDFWSAERGFVYGDAVDGVPWILLTDDGGRTWRRAPRDGLPAALDGEGGFAASGTCAVAGPEGRGWIATGNGARARVLRTDDYGASWRAVEVPVVGGSASGLATLSMDPSGVGLALGGVIGNDSIRVDNVARTDDGGATWSLAARLSMSGPAYGSALVPGRPALAVAVGPRGLDVTFDGGRSWTTADATTYWAVAFASVGAGWAVGPGGRITKLAFRPR
jgi:photosystem II stability/assembly factor-like uncharacterized protein